MARQFDNTALPGNREFAARQEFDTEGRDKDQEAFDAVKLDKPIDGTLVQKVAHFEAKARVMANNNNCVVLVAWYRIPHLQSTPPTIMADLVPWPESDAAIAEAYSA